MREGGAGSHTAGAGNISNISNISNSNNDNEAVIGWWRMAVAYCKSLLLVGRLFESAGMAEEAISALKEGRKMVRLCLYSGSVLNFPLSF